MGNHCIEWQILLRIAEQLSPPAVALALFPPPSLTFWRNRRAGGYAVDDTADSLRHSRRVLVVLILTFCPWRPIKPSVVMAISSKRRLRSDVRNDIDVVSDNSSMQMWRHGVLQIAAWHYHSPFLRSYQLP